MRYTFHSFLDCFVRNFEGVVTSVAWLCSAEVTMGYCATPEDSRLVHCTKLGKLSTEIQSLNTTAAAMSGDTK